MPTSGTMSSFGTTPSTKKGSTAWLLGHLRNSRKTYEREIHAYQSLTTHSQWKRDGCQADVLEIFAGKARISSLAHYFGLSAVQPFDLEYDINLMTKEGTDLLWNALNVCKPLLVVVEWPCKEWSLFNRNMNYSWRLDELEARREEQRPLVALGAQVCEHQIAQGRLYLGENPLRSHLWNEPEVLKLRDHPDNIETVCDAGAYGKESKDGSPVQKPHRWITNSECFAAQLQHKLTAEQKLYTKKIEGSDTTASGQYSDGMAQAILFGLQQEAKRRNPQRFHKQTTSIGSSSTAMRHSHASQSDAHSHGQTSEHSEQHQVYYAHPSHDTAAWAHVLDELETRFTNTYKRPFNIGESDELFTHIQQLAPWQLSRAQAVWTPAARRLPLDIPYTHRGCAYKNTQGQIALEHEDLSAVAYPKQRFAEAIRVALFFFGIPPEEEPPPEEHPEAELHEALPHTPATTSTRRVQGLETDIYFDGGPPLTQQQRTSIARLHCNLGHPPKAEIVRILAAAGKLDSKILSALDALRCGSCTRMTKTVKPPPSSTSTTKFSGAFGDHLQSDIIYIRLLTGEAIPTIGIVCMSTNYHAAKTLQDRSPDHVLDVMHEIWYRPFGLPLSITLDSDGAYLASNQAWHQHLGIEHNVIPAEESWRLGKIGRRNALMRTLAERLIDQTGAVTRHDLDLILTAVLNSMNTSTYTYGRSPCQAVFGRIPRPIGDILSDQTALSISPQLHPEQ